ncbi:MAG TPA: hypothetical protein VFV41_19640 [Streptosporangiaceae bacterium]|nr:hypothetical protein [Streptosporangiaceae bacterium]
MQELRTFLHYRAGAWAAAGRGRRPVSLAVACGAVVAVLAAGCGSGSASGGPAGSGGTARAQTAQQAMTDAVRATTKLNTAHATVTIVAAGQTLTEHLQLQLHPRLKASVTLNGMGGAGTIREIIIGTTAYIKISSLSAELGGKPWIMLSAHSGGKAGALMHSLLQAASSGNLNSQAQMAKLVKGLHAAGQQPVDGVPATRYDGSIKPSAALPHLPRALRSQLAPLLRQVQGSLKVSYWIDDQHLIRKVVETETVRGQQVQTTMVYQDINQPVHITRPPASQVRDSSSVPGLSA